MTCRPIRSLALLIAFAACPADDDDDGDSSESSTSFESTSGGSSGSGPSSSETDDGGAQDEGNSSATAGDEVGQCFQGCVGPADCCPVGSLGCPGEGYPNNWACNDGICEFGGCTDDLQCGLLGLTQECHTIDGIGTCFDPCASDSDCALTGGTCSGVADDGTGFCEVETPPCEDDLDCAGLGICDVQSGECYCLDDANCTDAAFNTCVEQD
jgi:hypothetical protein